MPMDFSLQPWQLYCVILADEINRQQQGLLCRVFKRFVSSAQETKKNMFRRQTPPNGCHKHDTWSQATPKSSQVVNGVEKIEHACHVAYYFRLKDAEGAISAT